MTFDVFTQIVEFALSIVGAFAIGWYVTSRLCKDREDS